VSSGRSPTPRCTLNAAADRRKIAEGTETPAAMMLSTSYSNLGPRSCSPAVRALSGLDRRPQMTVKLEATGMSFATRIRDLEGGFAVVAAVDGVLTFSLSRCLLR